jgi:hypothetical protein
MFKRLRDKIRADVQNLTPREVFETVALAVAVLMFLAFLGVFD